MAEVTLKLEALNCPSCAAKIESALRKLDGVHDVQVLFMSSKVKVSYEETQVNKDEIKQRIDRLGYDVLGEE